MDMSQTITTTRAPVVLTIVRTEGNCQCPMFCSSSWRIGGRKTAGAVAGGEEQEQEKEEEQEQEGKSETSLFSGRQNTLH